MMQQPEIDAVAPLQTPLSMRRQRFITLDMGELEEELRQQKAQVAAQEVAAAATSTPPVKGGGRLWAWPAHTSGPSETLGRFVSFCRFFAACVAGSLHTLAPPTLAAAEATSMLLVYFVCVPNAVPTHSKAWHYTFVGSAEDVVLLSILRCVAITGAHALGAGPRFQRPYLWTVTVFASLSVPLDLLKLVALRQSQWSHHKWPPFIALYTLHAGFAVAQVLAAQRIAEWTRKWWESGLAGFGYSWQEGEETWLLTGRLQSQATEEGWAEERACMEPDFDVPAMHLADPDSCWIECGGVRVHYKLALPLQGQHHLQGGTGVVLVHSFGGGTFSWRRIQQQLADSSGLPVLAFDRPGFGLTERPVIARDTLLDQNPYSLKFQVLLTLELASAVGLDRLVLAGHDDGALLALMVAAKACRKRALGSPPRALPASPSASPRGTAATAAGSSEALPATATHAVPMRGGSFAAASAAPCHHCHISSVGSLPESLDWAWMSSMPDGSVAGHSILQQLLKGDWPASIEPRTTVHPPSSAGVWPLGPWHSPLCPQSLGQHTGMQLEGRRLLSNFQLFPEREESKGEQGAVAAAEALAADATSSSTEQVAGMLPQESSLIDNPSFLSETSDHEQWQGRRYSTPEATAQHFLAEQQDQRLGQQQVLLELEELEGQDSWGDGGQQQQQQVQHTEEGQVDEEDEAAYLGLDSLHDNPSFVAADSLANELPPPPVREAREAGAAFAPAPTAPEGEGSLLGPAAAAAEAEEGVWRVPQPVGLILLHPDLSGSVVPKYARVLANSRLGRHVLRSLLRTEMGEVTNRRAWANPHHLTPDLLGLYRRPLHVQGWDKALIEVAHAHSSIHSQERNQLLAAVVEAGLPMLVATGECDHLVPPSAVSRVAAKLGAAAPRLAMLPQCGHLSHEEAPHVLLDFLLTFLRDLGLDGG